MSGEWTRVDTPTDSTIYDVLSGGERAYACGSDGLVLRRSDEGWEAIVENGPRNNGSSLYALDMTDDGRRLWFVGSSGIVGEYDLENDELETHTIGDFQNTYVDLAVTGEAGDATIFVGDGSGQVHFSFDNAGSWDYQLPGSGTELKGLDFYDDRKGYAVDADGEVFRTEDGETWEDALKETGVTLYSVICECEPAESTDTGEGRVVSHVRSDGSLRAVTAVGDGTVFRSEGDDWTREELTGTSLHDVTVPRDGDALAVGGGGLIRRYDGGWSEDQVPTNETFHGVCHGAQEIAVGSSGVIVERDLDGDETETVDEAETADSEDQG